MHMCMCFRADQEVLGQRRARRQEVPAVVVLHTAGTRVLLAPSPRVCPLTPPWLERPGSTEPAPCSRENAASPSAATAGGCLSFLSPLCYWERGAVRGAFFFPAVASKEEEPWHCGRVPLRQSPSRCPVPAGACGSRDRPSSPPPPCPLGALRVPSIEGTSLGACGGLPWACRLQEGPVVPPPSLPRTCCPLLLCPGCKAHGRLQHLTARSHLVRGTFPVPSASPGVVPALSVLGRAPRLPPAPRVRRDCSLLVC